MSMTLVPEIAAEAKALVALALRNGPVEDLHAGRLCPECSGRPEYSHISDEEIRAVMKAAVDSMYRLLWQRAIRSGEISTQCCVWHALRQALGRPGIEEYGARRNPSEVVEKES
jgi:hypothetical protein